MASLSCIEAFDDECGTLLDVLAELRAQDSGRATNCPPWTLHELVVHVAFSISIPQHLKVTESVPESSAADYFRRPERDTTAYRHSNVDRTRTLAATIDRAALSSVLQEWWKHARATFLRYEGDQLIEAGGLALTVDSYLLTRIISVAAHALDVAITMARPAWTTPAALRQLRPVLVDLLGDEPPAIWTDRDLLELGTGRRPLSDDDIAMLGPRAASFPLLS